MALVRFGGGVSEIRGSIAGNVFSRSRAGAIARNRAVPVNPNTVPQSLVRARMQGAADSFKTLSKDVIDQWNAFAGTQERTNRLGETYTPSGKQIFTEVFLNQALVGPPAPDLFETQADPNLPGITAFELDLDTGTGTPDTITNFLITGLETTDQATHIVVQATPQMLPSYSNVKKYFRQIAVEAVTPPGPQNIDIETAYVALYTGDVLEGNVIHIRARAISNVTGLGGAWIYDAVSVPAGV